MKAIELCPPKHLDAADLGGKDCVVTIKEVGFTEVGEAKEKKGFVLYQEFARPMVLNRTNVKRLIAHHGGDTSAWVGKQVTLYPSETDFAGKVVPCIRVRPKEVG